jgi:CMP-N,N'-diacetyllegionaminic acid synthase
MNIYCIILARKNSKRIINKNIINFKNKPLIYWTLEQSLRIKNLKKIILSSDSKIIKKIAKKISNKIYFNNRPNYLSGDKVTSEKVIIYLIKKYKIRLDDYIILLQPTSPLRLDIDINKMISCVKNNKLKSLHSVNNYKGKKVIKSKLNILNKNIHNKNLKKQLSYNGSIYIFKTSLLLDKKKIYEKYPNVFITNKKKSLDIDNYSDLFGY